jgi:hypothetical protein
MLLELRGIWHLEIGVQRAQALLLCFNLDVLRLGNRKQVLEHVADSAGECAADVVELSRDRVDGDKQVVGPNRIANVRPRPQGIQVARLYDWLDQSLLDHCDLLRECGFSEDIAPPWSRVREHPCHHDLLAIRLGVKPAYEVGACLGYRIRRRGMKRAGFCDRQLLAWNAPEDFGRRTDVYHRINTRTTSQDFQQSLCAEHICVQRLDRRGEAGFGIALCGEMKDVVRLCLLHGVLQGHMVAKVPIQKEDSFVLVCAIKQVLNIVERTAPAAHPENIPVGILQQIIRQVGSHHSRDAGNQRSWSPLHISGLHTAKVGVQSNNPAQHGRKRPQLSSRQRILLKTPGMFRSLQNCMDEPRSIDVVVLAGGLGKRLQSVVNDRPKPMALVQGKPFLSLLIDHVASFGYRRFILCAGYMADSIESFFDSARQSHEVVVIREDKPLGTAGALKHATKNLKSRSVLVLNGD